MEEQKNNIATVGNPGQQNAQRDSEPDHADKHTPESMNRDNRTTESTNSLGENPAATVKPTEQTGIVSTSSRIGQSEQTPPRRSTGPHTLLGKQRSKFNAIKHGIFSKVTLLKGEPHSQYQSLVDGLCDALRPEGKLEEILVEKLCCILWRYRRLLKAESAEILMGTKFLHWDRRLREIEEADRAICFPSLIGFGGDSVLMTKITNPIILEKCLSLLVDLRESVEANGFDSTRDVPLLRKLYGDENHSRDTLAAQYLLYEGIAEEPEAERQVEGYPTPEECKQEIVREIDHEIRRLKKFQKGRAVIESDRTRLQILRQNVPSSPELDRLLRYEATLERTLDRTLSQLERLQRMRRGQPVPPRIDVNIST